MKSEQTRRRVSWLIAAVLILPFLIYFHAGLQGSGDGPGGRAGKLFGKNVPWEEFEAHRAWEHRKWANQLGGSVPEEFAPLITQQTWDRLILLVQARRRKLTVGDSELSAYIRQQAVFQQDGRFAGEHYKRVLQAVGLHPAEFERRLREDLTIDKLAAGLKADVTASDEEARAAYQEANEQLRATLAVFDPADFASAASAEVTPEQVQAAYDARPDLVREPERVAGEYAGLTREAVAERATVSDEEIQAHYARHAAEFRNDDGSAKPLKEVQGDIRRQLREQKGREALVQLTLDLEDDVKAQRPFEELAAARGLTRQPVGPVPVQELGGLGVPTEVREALTELGAGQMSAVLETPAGVYVARVTERQPSAVPPLEQARPRIAQQLKDEAGRRLAREAAEAWRAQAAAGQEPEKPKARKRTATFTRTGAIEGLGPAPDVNRAAFDTPVGAWSSIVDAGPRAVAVKPEERLPADEQKFAAEIERWRQERLTKKQAEAFERWFAAIRQEAGLKSFVGGKPDP